MTIRRNLCGVLLISGLMVAPALAIGGQSGSTTPTIDPAKTGNSENDVTRMIRRDLAKNKSLSSYARSVKVMAVGNLVMLRGPVRSETERKTVLACAKKYAGDANVVDQTIIAK